MRKAFKAAIVALAVVAALPAVAEEAKDPARSRGDRALAGFSGCTENDFNAVLASNNFQIAYVQYRKAFETGDPAKMKAAAESGQSFAANCGEAAKAFFERKTQEWGKS